MQLYQKDAKTVRFMSKRLFGSRGMRFFPVDNYLVFICRRKPQKGNIDFERGICSGYRAGAIKLDYVQP